MGYSIRYQNRVVPLGIRPVAIGRSETCELRVDFDPLISRRHAIFVAEGSVATVEDLDSRNGVYVNGARIKGATPIKVGDRILVGAQELFLEDKTEKTIVDPVDVEKEGARTLASAPEPPRAPTREVDFVLIQGREYAVLPKGEYLRLVAAAEGGLTPSVSRAPSMGPVSKRSGAKKKR